MSITCGYFNSIDGDRKYNAETMTRYFEGLISDGVYNTVGDKLAVTSGDGLSVNVATGRAMISCRWLHNSSALNLELETPDTRMSRYDAIVLHLDLSDNVRNFTIKVKTGTSALDSPAKPSMTNTSLVKELCLAYVYVEGNAKSIKQKYIEDMRGSSQCPWVTGLIQQVDTSTLFKQFESAYNDLYTSWTKQFNDLLNAKKLEYEKWFSTLEQGLGVALKLKTYQNIVLTDAKVDTITVGIPQYLSDDVLLVNSNGLLLTETLDYTVEGEGANAQVKLLNGLESGNMVTLTVIKGTTVNTSSSTIVQSNSVVESTDSSTVETLISTYSQLEEE